MWRRVDLVWTGVSEERIASIFRVEKSASHELAWARGCSHQPTYLIVSGDYIKFRHRDNLKSYMNNNCIPGVQKNLLKLNDRFTISR
jgi:hypothetical protein